MGAQVGQSPLWGILDWGHHSVSVPIEHISHPLPPAGQYPWEITSPVCVPKPRAAWPGLVDSLVSPAGLSMQGAKGREGVPSTPECILVHDVDGDAVEPGLELHLIFLPPERGQRLPHRGSPVGQVALVTPGGTRLPLWGTPQPWGLPSWRQHPEFGSLSWGRDECSSLSLPCVVALGW